MTQYDHATEGETGRRPTVAELFAGVGGFHLALDRAGFDVVWSNQWEPATRAQHAFDCYSRHVANGDFQTYGRRRDTPSRSRRPRVQSARGGQRGHRQGPRRVRGRSYPVRRAPFSRSSRMSTVVGGFPCQDYSVAQDTPPSARPRRQEGRALVGDPPSAAAEAAGRTADGHLFLENVDRLIKSPTGQRGRDFAVMLASLADLGYEVEWRVVNAADYGFPQKRRRVFIIGRLGRSEATARRNRWTSHGCSCASATREAQ